MTVVVTGGAGRIGSAIVQTLCQQGHKVLLQYHTAVHQAESLQVQWPHLVSLFACDLLDSIQRQEFMQVISGRADIVGVVNNAGLFVRNPLERWSHEIDQRHWTLNTMVPMEIIFAAQSSLASHQGAVVNIVDNVSHHTPWPNYAGYAASKAGLVALTRSLAVELAPHIRVNAIGPGIVLAPEEDDTSVSHLRSKIPMKRWGRPEDVAEMIVFFLFSAKYCTGQVLAIDGGWSLSP